MTLLIEPSRIHYPKGGGPVERHSLETFTMEAAGIEDIDPVVRQRHPSATWFRAVELLPDGSQHWITSGSL